MLSLEPVISRNQVIELQVLENYGVTLHLKREDEIHPHISGNKWRKLRYHLEAARVKSAKGILTFGGAYSNHIAATAYASKAGGLSAIGVIRGERVEPLNQTLDVAEKQGMELRFVSRTAYRDEKEQLVIEFDPENQYYHVPEGGADAFGVKGCEEILSDTDKTNFDLICCSSGTGTTAAGIYNSLGPDQHLRVYPALKGGFALQDIADLLQKKTDNERLSLCDDYHFGGYAKTSKDLFEFMRDFHARTGIRTDPIYTAKMLYGVITDIKQGNIPKESRVLAIHTGGLQGIVGIEKRESVRIFDAERPDN